METLPKDILRLLLVDYLSPNDAVQCYLHIKLFHTACNVVTLRQIKMKYYSIFWNEHEPTRSLHGWVACSCGRVVKNKNVGSHRRKCLNAIIPIPQHCPHCEKSLYRHNGDVFINHLKKRTEYCPALSSQLRKITRWRFQHIEEERKRAEELHKQWLRKQADNWNWRLIGVCIGIIILLPITKRLCW
jgi:hypothetical protein